MKLIIEDDQGRRTVVPLVRDEITIGRNEQNVVTLAEKNVSRRHGRLFREAGRFYIEDLRSLTGIRVNGERILGRRPVEQGDLIQISEYDLMLEPEAGEKRAAEEGTSSRAQDQADAHGRALITVRPADVRESLAQPEAVEVPGESRARLVGISGTYRGTALVLDRTPIRIGSSSENDIVIHHPSISRRHLRLHLEGGAWKVLDAEPRNGVRVNGEPFLGIALRHGDVMEMGHVRFAFADAGRELDLPREFAPRSTPPTRSRPGSALPIGTVLGLVALLGAGALLLRQPSDGGDDTTMEATEDPKAERALALRSAEEALLGHRYVEAQRHLDAARRAGATSAELKDADAVKDEARGETLAHDLELAVAARDWDRARELASALRSSHTWYGDEAAPLAEAATAGYVAMHVAKAGALEGKDDGACLAEAQLALDADAKSAEAAKLAQACSAPRVRKAAVAAAPSNTPTAVRTARTSDSAPARKLIGEGNRKLMAQDFPAAIALYQQALVLKPGKAVLATAYRGMGVAFTRQGNIEEGAHYYKLYLPLCSDAAEKEQLQRLLDDYDARRR